MILERSCRSQIRGWLPRDAVPPLPVKATTVNRKIIDRTFLVGTIAVYLIILAFGAFIYNAFGTPIVWEVKTKVYYPIKEPQIEKPLQPYIGVNMTIGVFNGTIYWLGSTQDKIKQLNDIHIISYACIVNRNYYEGHLWSVTVELHTAVTTNSFILPNDTIGYEEAVIPVLGVNSPLYQITFNFSTAVSGVETWYE